MPYRLPTSSGARLNGGIIGIVGWLIYNPLAGRKQPTYIHLHPFTNGGL